MSTEQLGEDLVNLVGFLLTGAHGLFDEPPGYGPFRLLDAAGRLLAVMETAELADPFLTQLRRRIDEQRFGPSDDQALRAFLDQASLQFAAGLKGRVSTPSAPKS
jgi:hypothetical protein